MKLSIIVPVYNAERFVEKCLDSLINQLPDSEILAVNDGSTDSSPQILETYAQNHPNVIVLHKQNGGLSDARNFGIAKATGDYIGFVDSDDYVEPNMFSVMYQKAVENDWDIVVCDTFMDSENSSYVLQSNENMADSAVKNYILSYPNAPARLIKTSLMKQQLFKKGVLYEDLQLMPQLALKTDKIGFVHQPFYHYIQNPSSIMHAVSLEEKHRDIFHVLEDVRTAYRQSEKYETYFSELEYLHIVHLQRSAVLRFLDYQNNRSFLKQVDEVMNQNFKNWTQNPYFKKSNLKFKLVCYLAKFHCYFLIKLLKAVH